MDKKTIVIIIAVCSAVCFLLGAGMFFLIDTVTDSKIEDALAVATTTSEVATEETSTAAPTTAPTETKVTEKPTEKPAQKPAEKPVEEPVQEPAPEPVDTNIIPYTGMYYDQYNTSYIEVTSVGSDYFVFNGSWYRIWSMENETAFCSGNEAHFSDQWTQGTIRFLDKGTMEVIIDSTSIPAMEGNNITFTYQP